MSDELASRLGQVPLFAGMPKRALKRLVEEARTVDHPPGREVAAQGLGALAFHYLLAGSAHVDVSGSPRAALGPGEYFGEISLIDGKPRSANVRAGEEGMQTLAISQMQFKALLEKYPEMMHQLLINLCDRLRRVESAPAAVE
jgi:CRP-like cAMP-binding protein